MTDAVRWIPCGVEKASRKQCNASCDSNSAMALKKFPIQHLALRVACTYAGLYPLLGTEVCVTMPDNIGFWLCLEAVIAEVYQRK